MKRWVLYAFYGLGGVLVLSAFAFVVFQPIQVLPRIRLAPGFSLTDQDGQRLTNEDLRGTIALYSFTYTRCAADCPQTSPTLLEIQRRLAEIDPGVPVRLVTISFDPQHDTPHTLADYAHSLQADTTTWTFATGSDAGLLKTVIGAGFEAYYQPDTQGGFDYNPTYVVVDGWGIIRGEYHYQTLTPDVERILRHIGVLAEEVRNSVGAARYAYEAAHLFLCYAP